MQMNVFHGIQEVHNSIKDVERRLTELSEPTTIDLFKLELELRRIRERLFPKGYFADAAWDILLDLADAERTNRNLAVSDVGLCAGVPQTTALRYISMLTNDGFIYREQDSHDRRRAYLRLTEDGRARVNSVFQTVQDKFLPERQEPLRSSNDI